MQTTQTTVFNDHQVFSHNGSSHISQNGHGPHGITHGIRAVFFDLDDTIIKEAEGRVHGKAWNNMLKRFGWQFYRYDSSGNILPTPDTIDGSPYIDPDTGLKLLPKSLLPGTGKPPPEVTRHLVHVLALTEPDDSRVDWRLTEDERRTFVFRGVRNGSLNVEPNEGVIELMHEIKKEGLGLGKITSGFSDYDGAVSLRLGIDPKMFDARVCGGQGVKPKPNRETFDLALLLMRGKRPDLSGLQPQNAVMVGDSGSDMGAKKWGWNTIGLDNPYNPEDKLRALGADHVVRSLNQVRLGHEGMLLNELFSASRLAGPESSNIQAPAIEATMQTPSLREGRR